MAHGQTKVADPVLPHSGEFVHSETPLTIPGRRLDYRFTLTYRSQLVYNGPAGWGWQHNYDRRVVATKGGSLGLQDGAGLAGVFSFDGTLLTPSAGRFTAVISTTTDITLTERSGIVEGYYPLDGSPAAGRLRSIADRNGNTLRFTYDALGRRVGRQDAAGATRYLYAGGQVIEERSGIGAMPATYVEDLATERGGNQHFYQTDALGSVRGLANAGGAVVERVDYDPFGAPAFSGAGSSSALGNPLLFRGRYYDADAGLYVYGGRRYDPATGRFQQRGGEALGNPRREQPGALTLINHLSGLPSDLEGLRDLPGLGGKLPTLAEGDHPNEPQTKCSSRKASTLLKALETSAQPSRIKKASFS